MPTQSNHLYVISLLASSFCFCFVSFFFKFSFQFCTSSFNGLKIGINSSICVFTNVLLLDTHNTQYFFFIPLYTNRLAFSKVKQAQTQKNLPVVEKESTFSFLSLFCSLCAVFSFPLLLSPLPLCFYFSFCLENHFPT